MREDPYGHCLAGYALPGGKRGADRGMAPTKTFSARLGQARRICRVRKALFAGTAPGARRNFPVVHYDLPPTGVGLSGEDAATARLCPGAAVGARLDASHVAPTIAIFIFTRTRVSQPGLTIRRGKHIAAATADTVMRRVLTGRTAASNEDDEGMSLP